MERSIPTLLLAAALLAPASQARAEHEPHYPLYLGFGLGFPGADTECDHHGYDCDGSDTSFRIYGGKRLHRNLGFEISIQDLGKLRDEDGSLTTTAESEGINFSLLGIIPTGEYGYFYGKAGYMLWDTEYARIDRGVERSDDDGVDFSYGIGYAITFSEAYDFRIEFESLNDLGDEFVAGGAKITVLSFSGSFYLD